ncbi:hypothetical protein POV27_14525 [Aureisphaera galaxeae]|uniref:hypothetical protein n=1 Tax=Aureisphaera galaxeae TaxID=1538023 RepID=UPI00234FBB72|nr:hypothetical protein [Aureisphaera galaxeae]MDC8005274.1 hypothetical protein [Aureisphaera galaxeae]
MRATYTILFIGFFFTKSLSQDFNSDFNHRYGFNLDYRFTKKTKLQTGFLSAFNADNYDPFFYQFKLGLDYRFNKRISGKVFYKPILLKGNTEGTWRDRFGASLDYRSTLFGLPLRNRITAEGFFPTFNKYQYRFVYYIKLNFKNDFLPLRATPYINYQLYYYLGGNPLDYYDEDGETLLASNPPNGFHRYRIGAGIRFRAERGLYVTLYYIWQEEFNTTFQDFRQINILNRNQTSIRYPFNDYQVLGVSVSYTISTK